MDSMDFLQLARIYFGERAELASPISCLDSHGNMAPSTANQVIPESGSLSNLFPVVKFIEESLPGITDEDLDFEPQLLSCAFQVLAKAESSLKILPKQDMSFLRSLVETLRVHRSRCQFLARKALAAGFALFEELQINYFRAVDHDLSGKIEIASCLLDHFEKKFLPMSLHHIVREIFLYFSTIPLKETVLFLEKCIQAGRQLEIIRHFGGAEWSNVQRYFHSICAESDDVILMTDFLIFLNGFFNYAEDLPTLQLTVKSETAVYNNLSAWVFSGNFHGQSINRATPYTVGFATLDISSPSTCSCRTVKKQILLVLKSCCVLLRHPKNLEENGPIRSRTTEMLKIFMLNNCPVHVETPFGRRMCSIFANDDGELCCALLCCLHLHFLLEREAADELSRLLPSPEAAFDGLLEVIAADHFVLISWLTDNQNCFLAYFLQYLKHLGASGSPENQRTVFRGIFSSLSKLHAANKVAFNPAPLLRRLQSVLMKEQTLTIPETIK